jgi:peptidoglycan/xylan/chitin deacetylase (PgdA/CDA1 family)
MISYLSSFLHRTKGHLLDVAGRLYYPRRQPKRPIVLMYHSIFGGDRPNWGPWAYSVEQSVFCSHINRLAKEVSIVPFSAVVDWVRGEETIPDGAVALTFDDGYANFTTEALPILERYDVPATVFVSTALVDESAAPFEHRLAAALKSASSVELDIGGTTFKEVITSESETIKMYDQIRSATRFASSETREQVLMSLDAPAVESNRVLSSQELRTIADHSLVTVGSHGHKHIPYIALSAEEQRGNAIESLTFLNDTLGRTPDHFSFPYGSYNQSSINRIKGIGFQSAVTTAKRRILPRDWNSSFTLPRCEGSAEIINRIVSG